MNSIGMIEESYLLLIQYYIERTKIRNLASHVLYSLIMSVECFILVMIYMFTSEFMNRFDMQQNGTTDEDDNNGDNNGDNNIKKKGKLKTIVLSPNVNDYDTGEDNLT